MYVQMRNYQSHPFSILPPGTLMVNFAITFQTFLVSVNDNQCAAL